MDKKTNLFRRFGSARRNGKNLIDELYFKNNWFNQHLRDVQTNAYLSFFNFLNRLKITVKEMRFIVAVSFYDFWELTEVRYGQK